MGILVTVHGNSLITWLPVISTCIVEEANIALWLVVWFVSGQSSVASGTCILRD